MDRELECLAYNIYHEARGEPKRGQLAVALVTLNRVDSKKYPDTICGVVYQKYQFSWTKNSWKFSKVRPNEWKTSMKIAKEAYGNRYSLGYFKATHYHNTTVRPKWRLKKVAKIGKHIFYK